MEPEYDFLKYWRIVRYWARVKYEVSTAELDLLLYLHSEGPFTRDQVMEYEQLMSFDKDRFRILLRDKIIIKWRKGKSRSKAMFVLSFDTKMMITAIYRKLAGLQGISENYQENPVFDELISNNNNKRYRKAIKKLNERIKLKADQEYCR